MGKWENGETGGQNEGAKQRPADPFPFYPFPHFPHVLEVSGDGRGALVEGAAEDARFV